MSGYIPLRNEGNSQEEEAYFALSVSTWTHHVTFLEAKALTQSSEMGKVRVSFVLLLAFKQARSRRLILYVF